MPSYAWICQVCSAANPPGMEVCAGCSAPAELNAVDIARRRRQAGIDTSPEPVRGRFRRRLRHAGVWLPAAYLLIVLLCGLPVVFCSGDMCTFYLLVALMPWVMIPPLVPFPIFNSVPALSWVFVGVGFIVNLGILRFVGGLIDAWARKAGKARRS
jgi:hypothetical protein